MTIWQLAALVVALGLLLVGVLSVVTALRKLQDRPVERAVYGSVLLAPPVIWIIGTQSLAGVIGGLMSAPFVSVCYVLVRGWWSHLFITLNMLLLWGMGADGDGGGKP